MQKVIVAVRIPLTVYILTILCETASVTSALSVTEIIFDNVGNIL